MISVAVGYRQPRAYSRFTFAQYILICCILFQQVAIEKTKRFAFILIECGYIYVPRR